MTTTTIETLTDLRWRLKLDLIKFCYVIAKEARWFRACDLWDLWEDGNPDNYLPEPLRTGQHSEMQGPGFDTAVYESGELDTLKTAKKIYGTDSPNYVSDTIYDRFELIKEGREVDHGITSQTFEGSPSLIEFAAGLQHMPPYGVRVAAALVLKDRFGIDDVKVWSPGEPYGDGPIHFTTGNRNTAKLFFDVCSVIEDAPGFFRSGSITISQ